MKTSAILIFFLSLALVACSPSRPPDDIVRQGIEANATSQARSLNGFVRSVRVESYRITNTYERNGAFYYDYEAAVQVGTRAGNYEGGFNANVKGTEGFRKEGNRWDMFVER